jgi:multidrug transporter EmrE-like cation transporter
MSKTNQLSRLYHTRTSWALIGIISFIMAYAFGSWALDTARYWYYIATLVFIWAGFWFIGRAIKNDHK